MSLASNPVAGPGRKDLDKHFVSGVGWTAIAKWGGQAFSWAALLLLAKLLNPSDFGLLSMTSVLLGLITMFTEFGIDGAIVLTLDLTPLKIRQIHSLAILLGCCGATVAALSAPFLAMFFHQPELKKITPVLALTFIIGGFKIVPQAVLLRELRFQALSMLEIGQVFLQAGSSVVLAWMGMRYWSLIGALLISSASTALFSNLLRPCGLAKLDPRHIREELTFGWQLMGTRFSWYFYSNADFAVAGRMLGADALGIYTMAWNIASVPVEKITALLTRVTPSILMKVQNNPVERNRYIRLFTEGLAIATFPLAIGLALVARPLMLSIFDQRWTAAIGALALLALCTAVRSIAAVWQPVLSVSGEVRFSMWINVMMACTLPFAFLFGSHWGPTGIGAAWLICYPLLSLPLLARMLSTSGVSLAEYCSSLKVAVLACGAMSLGVLAVSMATTGLPQWVRLALEVLTGTVVYAGLLLLFFKPRIQALLSMIRGTGNPLGG